MGLTDAEIVELLGLKITVDNKDALAGMDAVGKKAGGLGGLLQGALGMGAGVLGANLVQKGISAITGGFSSLVTSGEEGQRVEAQLDAALQSTAGSADQEGAAMAGSAGKTKMKTDTLISLKDSLTAASAAHDLLNQKISDQEQKLAQLESSTGKSSSAHGKHAKSTTDSSDATAKHQAALESAKTTLEGMQNTYAAQTAKIELLNTKLAEGSQVIGGNAAALGNLAGAVRPTKDQIEGLAATMTKTIPVTRDSILAEDAMLVTFTNIGKGTLPQATQAVTDMAFAMNSGATPSAEQLSSTAQQVGKALQDPITGMTTLKRVGIEFSDAQKAQIKTMMDAGNVAGAQAMILGELETKFGGSGKAAGATFAGQMQIAQNQVQAMKEQLGEQLLPSINQLLQVSQPLIQGFFGALLAVLPGLVAGCASITGQVAGFVTTLEGAFSGGGLAGGGNKILSLLGLSDLGAIQGPLGALVGFIQAMLPPIRTIVESVFGDVAAFLRAHGTQIVGFLSGAWRQIGDIVSLTVQVIQAIVVPVFTVVAGFIKAHGDQIQTILLGAWTAISSGIKLALDVIEGVLKIALDVLRGNWQGAWDDFKTMLGRVWTDIKGVFQGNLDEIIGILQAFNLIQIGQNIIDGLISGIKSDASKVKQAILEPIDDAVGGVKNLLGIHSPSEVFASIGQDSAAGLVQGWQQGTNGNTFNVSALTNDSVTALAGGAGPGGAGLNVYVTVAANAVQVQSADPDGIGQRIGDAINQAFQILVQTERRMVPASAQMMPGNP